MLITYRLSDGTVVDSSGTNGAVPDGPPDEAGFLNTDARGIDRADLGLLRLHDNDDAEQVALAFSRSVRVEAGRLVDVGPMPEPSADPAQVRARVLREQARAATSIVALRAVVVGLLDDAAGDTPAG